MCVCQRSRNQFPIKISVILMNGFVLISVGTFHHSRYFEANYELKSYHFLRDL